jgi:hypothetical protein
MFNRPKPPLTVVVSDGQWAALGEPTPRNIWLTKMLTLQGGVNESVSNGTYHYNVKRSGLKHIATLLPAK